MGWFCGKCFTGKRGKVRGQRSEIRDWNKTASLRRRLQFMNIVLVEPEIPPNTGNVARLCAATHSTLHLIEPLGFKLDDAQLKRAGMDYWQHVDWKRWPNWAQFMGGLPSGARLWYIESGGPRLYSEARFGAE